MPHFMVRITVAESSGDRLLTEPRGLLDAVREVATDTGGHLDGCWFTDDGRELVAVYHDPALLDQAEVETVFRQIGQSLKVDVQQLHTLRELEIRSSAGDTGVKIDPVDLGSDLSFPASDPPSWYLGSAR